MASIKIAYGTATALTNNIGGLASSSDWLTGYESTEIDNSSALYHDYLIEGHVTVNATSVTAGTEIRVKVVASWDGTTWPNFFDGNPSSEFITGQGVHDSYVRHAATMWVDTTTGDRAYPYSFTVANLYGGKCPTKFVLWICHNTGAALRTGSSNHPCRYRGVYRTIA